MKELLNILEKKIEKITGVKSFDLSNEDERQMLRLLLEAD